MITEPEYKKSLIKRLGLKNGWVDGDLEKTNNKKVDILNHKLKIAIEIKDDTVHKTIQASPENPIVTQTTNLVRMNKILSDHIKDARLKFKNYSDYKTILLIRTEHRVISTVRYSIDGLHTYSKTDYLGRIGKYSHHIRENVGCYIIYDYERKLHYVPNQYCKLESNLVTKIEAEVIFGEKISAVVVV